MKLAFFFLAGSLAFAQTDIRGFVQWNELCPGISDLGIESKAVLDGGVYQGRITKQGNFSIPQVPAGVYVLSLISHSHVFDSYQLNVESPNVQVRTHVPGTPMVPSSALESYPALKYPIALVPRANYRTSKSYFVPRESFNLFAMFQSPMMLMMLFAGVMVLAMPYLMKNLENLDPESAEEMKAQQVKLAGVQNALAQGDFKAGFAQLLSGDETANASASSAKTATPAKARGKHSHKKR